LAQVNKKSGQLAQETRTEKGKTAPMDSLWIKISRFLLKPIKLVRSGFTGLLKIDQLNLKFEKF
jgi:hypothetical protein